ncbi:MAG TPA: FAD-dependent oxidoreductase [Thermoanaerobaculia bacterium]
MTPDFDIAIAGSGFAGSLLALICRRLGRSVVLIEKGSHPRFAIGESSSPLANLILEELADRYDLPRIRPLAAWGSWQREYPEIGCGLKRGFTFYGHAAGRPFAADPERRNELLVAASPRDEVADTHWLRADFDHFLVREAQAEGVEYLDQTRIDGVESRPDGVALRGERHGSGVTLRARFLVDASGPRGLLHAALGLSEARFPTLPQTQGLYSHFVGVRRFDELGVLAQEERPPYPVDDAALHHVFDGGWIWMLRFGNGLVSAGVAAEPRLADALRLCEGEPAWARLLRRFPTIEEQFVDARPVRAFAYAPTLPFRSAAVAGENWTLLPSAAAFVDPILSTGFPLTLLGIERLSRAIERGWGSRDFERMVQDSARSTLAEAETSALLVSALYSAFSDFDLFAELTLLYFAAASFAEASRRLGRGALAGSFLSSDHPVFGPALAECCRLAVDSGAARSEKQRSVLLSRIAEAIEPIDVAGLGDRKRRRWHPMEAEPLLRSAHKLGVSRAEIEAMLESSGFYPPARAEAPENERAATLVP